MVMDATLDKPASRSRRIGVAMALLVLCSALAACLLVPGKFTSSLDLRKDGHFAFAYKGEIHFVSPGDMGDGPGSGPTFQPEPCETKSGAERACNPAEIDKQMRAWQERQQQEKAAETERMTAMTGGMDLSDPKTAEEFARKLERQHGWRSVKSMGKGRFDVDFAVSGTLTHDFTFPVMEDYPLANPFVQVLLREDGTVRVLAPAFSNGPGGSPFKAMAQLGMAGATAGAVSDEKANPEAAKTPQLPRIDGQFTLTTDAVIVANNTDEGPSGAANGAQLTWTINERTDASPKALIKLSR
jgi:hypothetical protein